MRRGADERGDVGERAEALVEGRARETALVVVQREGALEGLRVAGEDDGAVADAEAGGVLGERVLLDVGGDVGELAQAAVGGRAVEHGGDVVG